MVDESEPPTSVHEQQSLWGSTSRENILDMAKRFTASSQSFMETLQTLRGILEGQIRKEIHYSSPSYINPFGSFAVMRLWRPPRDFDYSGFTNAVSETYEAWRIAKRSNHEIAEFEGESLGSLVSLFNKLRYQPISSDGSEDSDVIAEFSLDFKTKVDRLEWLLSLKSPEEKTQSRESSPRGSIALHEVADPEETTVSARAFKLEQQSERETDWSPTYFTVSELTQMRKNVKLPHSRTQMTREINKEVKNGRILRDGNKAMRLRMDLYKEWSTHSNE